MEAEWETTRLDVGTVESEGKEYLVRRGEGVVGGVSRYWWGRAGADALFGVDAGVVENDDDADEGAAEEGGGV